MVGYLYTLLNICKVLASWSETQNLYAWNIDIAYTY